MERSHRRRFSIKVDRSRRHRKHKLFGIGGQLAGDGRRQGAHGERERSVLHQTRRRNSAGGACCSPLRLENAGRPAVSALPHLRGAEFGCSEAGGGKGDGLWGGVWVHEACDGWRWGGRVGRMGTGVGRGAGGGVTEQARAGRGRKRSGRAGKRPEQGGRRPASDGHKHLSLWVEAQTFYGSV